VRAHDKLGLLSDLDPHLARRDRADPHLVGVCLQLERLATGDGVNVKRDVFTDRDNLIGGKVGF
jgi:hypothetical protein